MQLGEVVKVHVVVEIIARFNGDVAGIRMSVGVAVGELLTTVGQAVSVAVLDYIIAGATALGAEEDGARTPDGFPETWGTFCSYEYGDGYRKCA